MSSKNLTVLECVGVATSVLNDSSCNADHPVSDSDEHGNRSGSAAADDDEGPCIGGGVSVTIDVQNQTIDGDNNDGTATHIDSIASEIVLPQDLLRPIQTNNDAIPHVDRDNTQRTNYTSAHISTLGTDSDRMDFCRRSQTSAKGYDDQCERRILSEEDDTNSVVSLKKIRKWFSASSSPGNNTGVSNTDYHTFQSEKQEMNEMNNRSAPESNDTKPKPTLNDDDFDESLLNDTIRGRKGQKKRSIHPWVKQSKGVSHRSSTLAGTEEEERVMGECSFFYNNMDDTDMIPSQQSMPGSRSTTQSAQGRDDNEQEDDSYLEHPQGMDNHHYHYRTRRVDPRTISNAIKTRAKRQWTERRYRRRLRQSQLGMVSFDGIANSENMMYSPNNNLHGRSRRRLLRPRRDDSSTSYWHTKEHQRAFLAAHSALNGKLAYENGNKDNRRNTSSGYDIDDDYYDLELAITQDEDAEVGVGETRAYVTKSSLAIRGGLIRLPTDNVRLVCDPMLQPGILSIETRELTNTSGGGRVGRRLPGNIQNNDGARTLDNSLPQFPPLTGNAKKDNIQLCDGSNIERRQHPNQIMQQQKQQYQQQPQQWSRQELAYVLTVDERIYQRVVQEMGDSYRIPCGLYYCCHVTTGGDHVGIGVAVAILSLLFVLLIAGMIAWPTV
jgi:hypothetical protein